MAVVNQYKFYGITVTAAETATLLSPDVNETIIIKSIRLSNLSGSNNPIITLKDKNIALFNAQTLAHDASLELLTQPLIVEGGTTFTYTTSGTVSAGVAIGISYLNIKKEVTT